MKNSQEEFIATLIHPDEYMRHLNQVASVTTKNITFLKKKFISKAGIDLVKYPISDVNSIMYKDERPILMIILGLLLILLILFIFYMVAVNWDSLEPGTKVPIGLLGLAVLYGVRWILGARRHKIIFILKDRTKLIWKSRSGDYKLKLSSSQNVIEFANSAGLLQS